MNNTKKGFTLVELLVVIAILAILATVSVVGYTSFIDRANESNAQTEADQIKSFITNGLMTDDCVLLVADDTTTDNADESIYAYDDNGTVKFQAGKPTDAKTTFNATADVAELVTAGGKLEITSETVLTYTNFEYDVDVMTRESKKSE